MRVSRKEPQTREKVVVFLAFPHLFCMAQWRCVVLWLVVMVATSFWTDVEVFFFGPARDSTRAPCMCLFYLYLALLEFLGLQVWKLR